jgi:hypothetical protein
MAWLVAAVVLAIIVIALASRRPKETPRHSRYETQKDEAYYLLRLQDDIESCGCPGLLCTCEEKP